MSKVSVLLAHYHEEAQPYLSACLRSLEQQTFQDFELIVVWSNHAPKLSGRVDKEFGSSSRLHFPAAIEKAYELSDPNSEFILLLNDDCIMDKHCLEELVNTAKSAPDLIFGPRSNCGPIMGFYDTVVGFMQGDRLFQFPRQFRYKDVEPYIDSFINDAIKYTPGVFMVPFSPFFCTLMRRSTYEKVGKINSKFRTGADDKEFSDRAAKLGIRCYVVLHASCAHASGVSADLSLTDEDRNFNIQLLRELS